jgi:hypothetical protein
VIFFAPTGFSAFFAAHRFFKAATIAALPLALSLRFGFVAPGVAGAGSDSPFNFAHLAFCPRAILRLAAAEMILRFLAGASGLVAATPGPPGSIARSSAIWASIRVFWDSNPSMAAMMISFVSLGVGINFSIARFHHS